MELDYKAIGKRIKIARIKADLTQEKLSEIVGVSPTHLSNIETGTTRVSLNAIVNWMTAMNTKFVLFVMWRRQRKKRCDETHIFVSKPIDKMI